MMATACCALTSPAAVGYGFGSLSPENLESAFAAKLWYMTSGFARRMTPTAASAAPFQNVNVDMVIIVIWSRWMSLI